MKDHIFSRIPSADIPRSVMPLSHNLKTTMGTDYLYPIFVAEALPADVWVFKQTLFGRMTTPLTPIMDNLYLDTFYFAIPVRLIDKDFKKLMGERPYGVVDNDYTAPMLNTGNDGVAFGSFYDYIGIPPNVPNLEFSAWVPRAYQLVWNEWFRDENLVQGAKIAGVRHDGTTGDELLQDYVLRKRGKRHDYFTSCLPWPQKGQETMLPLGEYANIVTKSTQTGNLDDDVFHFGFAQRTGNYSTQGTLQVNVNAAIEGITHANFHGYNDAVGEGDRSLCTQNSNGLVTDLSTATAVSVNHLREAFAIQQLCEQWARGGTRYTEILRAAFNVVSPDARQQRPEYLGGSSQPLNVTAVAQTSASTTTSALGNLASYVTMTNDASWTKSFTEHTIILGLANIRADLSYQQGLPRMYSRKTKFDFYWPALANLGEQAVLNKEIYAQGTAADNQVFGYQERWAEYRYMPNRITGKMRSTDPQTLDVWHLAQKFTSLPTLNASFIQEKVPIDRVVAVTDEPPFIVDGYFDIRAARPMPLYSVPGLRRM